MAIPTTKATLKSYCLRSLGFGVIDINVSDDQAMTVWMKHFNTLHNIITMVLKECISNILLPLMK